MLDEILSPRRVFLDLGPKPKSDLLRELAHRLKVLGEVKDADSLAARLIEREAMITTGVSRGFAFPHAFSPEVEQLGLTIASVRGGTEYESLDGRPVEFVLLLIGPPYRQDVHLRLLARISRIARKPGMIEALREVQSPEEMVELFAHSDRLLASSSAA